MKPVLFPIIFIIIFGTFITTSLCNSKTEVHNEKYTEGNYLSNKLINVKEIKEKEVLFTIGNEDALLKENESYVLNKSNKYYKGYIEVLNIEDNTVNVKVNIERTSYYHMLNIIIIGLPSLIATILLASIIEDVIRIRQNS